jgi:RHS repeat-associated protein
LGRIVNKTETIQGVTHIYRYTYDANGRLTDVTTDGVATSHYAYDANGNRTMGPGLVASPVYDNQDRLLSYGNCTYAYKAEGSLQTKTCAGATTRYDYDAFIYLIDGQNRRVGKKVNGALVESFVYEDDLGRVAWYDSTGALKAQFVFGRRTYVPDYMIKAGQNYRLIYDQLGTVRLVFDPTGAIVERIDYDEFGNTFSDTAPGLQPFGFAGGLRDSDTLLDYEAVVGRWIAKDPVLFDGGAANVYSYVNNDPLNNIDPAGLALWGTTSCDYYTKRCAEVGGEYYCQIAPKWCRRFPQIPSCSFWPSFSNCTRQCLQECDAAASQNQNKCPLDPDPAGFWSNPHFSCHVICYTACSPMTILCGP